MRVLSPGFSYRYESIYENTTHDGVQSKSCAVLHYSRSRDARTLAICPISSIACPLLPYAGIHGFGSQKQSSLVRLREKQALTRSSATPFLSHTPESSFIMESRFHCAELQMRQHSITLSVFSQAERSLSPFCNNQILNPFFSSFFEPTFLNRSVSQAPGPSEQTVHCHSVSSLRYRRCRSLR